MPGAAGHSPEDHVRRDDVAARGTDVVRTRIAAPTRALELLADGPATDG
jgi:hypothetical protein